MAAVRNRHLLQRNELNNVISPATASSACSFCNQDGVVHPFMMAHSRKPSAPQMAFPQPKISSLTEWNGSLMSASLHDEIITGPQRPSAYHATGVLQNYQEQDVNYPHDRLHPELIPGQMKLYAHVALDEEFQSPQREFLSDQRDLRRRVQFVVPGEPILPHEGNSNHLMQGHRSHAVQYPWMGLCRTTTGLVAQATVALSQATASRISTQWQPPLYADLEILDSNCSNCASHLGIPTNDMSLTLK